MHPPDSSDTALVICYGNPMRRDDGVALAVAELLTGATSDAAGAASGPRAPLAGVSVRALHQLDPALCEDMAAVSLVVFVDAERVQRPPAGGGGAVGAAPAGRPHPRIQPLEPRPASGFRANVHAVTPSDLLTLTERLYGARPEAFLVAVPAYDMGHGEGLSGEAREAAEEAAGLVRRLLRR